MKYFKPFIFAFIICVILGINIRNLSINAHTSNLGIEGWEGYDYDPCQPYPSPDGSTTSCYNEKWYGLRRTLGTLNRCSHIDNDLFTLYYKFYNDGTSLQEQWLDWYPLAMAFVETGLKQWNDVYLYEENEAGYLELRPVVNLVNVDTLDDPSSVDVNIELRFSDETNSGCGASTICDYDSEVLADHQEYNGVSHMHYTKYIITFYPLAYAFKLTMMDEMYRNGVHEMGHVFGLVDLDAVEYEPEIGFHHQEMLMGYTKQDYDASFDVTYYDLAGVMVTRGIHQNSDHRWLYDSSKSVDGHYKMICSICNCIKYFNSLSDCSYNIYKSCNDNHDFESGNMMLMGRNYKTDLIKCRYCRYVCPFYLTGGQNYVYYDDCDENYHFASNKVGGFEYIVKEPHRYYVTVDDTKDRCYLCSRCNDGSKKEIADHSVDTECLMEKNWINFVLEANESKIIKINPKCKNIYNFSITSDKEIEVDLFDNLESNLFITTTKVGNKTTWEGELKQKTYYLRIMFKDVTDTGNISVSFESNNTYCKTPIEYNESKNVFDHLHNGHSEFIYKGKIDRFVNIELNVESTNDLFILQENAISITDINGNVINKFQNHITDLAVSKQDQYSLCVFLLKNTEYIIKINCEQTVTEATLSIKPFNADQYDCLLNPTLDLLETTNGLTDYFIRINFDQVGRYKGVLSYEGQNCNAKLCIIRKGYDENDVMHHYVYTQEFSSNITTIEKQLNFTFGSSYYVGFFGGTHNTNLALSFKRVITNETMDVLIEPGVGYDYGSEVRLNGGARNSTIITQGHTRLLYFSTLYAPSASRLDYYWYSALPDILEVSEYGTILATNVTHDINIYITAVYKHDLSKVFHILMNVKKETKTDQKIISYQNIVLDVGQKYQPTPDNRWPSTYRQHYVWSLSDTSLGNATIWGSVYAQKVGNLVLTGNYKYNNRYQVVVEITIK